MTSKHFFRILIIGIILISITYFLDLRSLNKYERDISDTVEKFDDIFLSENYNRKFDSMCGDNIYTKFYYVNKDIRSSVCVSNESISLERFHDFSKNDLGVQNDLELLNRYDEDVDFLSLSNSISELIEECSIDKNACQKTLNVDVNSIDVKVFHTVEDDGTKSVNIQYKYEKSLEK